jgi:putative ABC transport system ATP-binding protein/macrolide transport system ATP-binding/permease protein/lipoprotein-releasing system ATP-binding protein
VGQPVSAAEAPVPLGQGLRQFLAGFATWAVLTALLILGANHGLAFYQKGLIDEKQRTRRAAEQAALTLRADIDDLTQGPDQTYELTLYLWNVSGDRPTYVMAPSVRAFVQVGMQWQEVPLRPADERDGQVLRVTGKQKYRYVFRPNTGRFDELLPGYMHVRVTNAMLVSRSSQPSDADELVERADNYYVYLKPHNADDAVILRKLKFPGKPPVWIPMPPH